MSYTTHKFQQGSAEWAAHRARHLNASDAAAMLGISSYKSRADLLKEVATGVVREIDPATRARFDKGHEFEHAARPLVEAEIGEDLFPVIVSMSVDGLDLSASLDGTTMDGMLNWEHKTANERLHAAVSRGEIPTEYEPQMEQGLLINGAEKCLFSVSLGTPESLVSAEYLGNADIRSKLLAGWKQFNIDLFAYNAPPPDPVVEKMALMALPTLAVQIVGEVTTSNLPAYRNSALEFIKSINTDLQNDQDFADAEQTVKFCETAEKNIEAVKAQAIAQTATIDELFRSLDQIADAMRQKRLMLDRLVKTRKEQIRTEIVTEGRNKWIAHLAELNTRLRRISVTVSTPDFATAIKGKRTLSSVRDAVDSVLTTAKIAATQQADLFAARLTMIDEIAKDHAFLVRDLSALVLMTPDTLSAVIKQRITDHQAEQERKAEQARQVEAARVQREADAAAARELQLPPAQTPAASPAQPAATPTATVTTIPTQAPTRTGGAVPPYKPTAAELVEVVARSYQVSTAKALEWLLSTDFERYSEVSRGAPF